MKTKNKNNKILVFGLAISIILILGILPLVYSAPIWSKSQATSFTIGKYPVCVMSNQESFWKYLDETTGLVVQVSSRDNCRNDSGVSQEGNDMPNCCPTGDECRYNDDSDKYICITDIIPTDIEPVSCSNYTREGDCKDHQPNNLPEKIKNLIEDINRDNLLNFIKNYTVKNSDSLKFCHLDGPLTLKGQDKNGAEKCFNIMSCRCEWVATTGINGKCVDAWSVNEKCAGPIDYPENKKDCQQSSKPTINTCDQADGKIVISWTAKVIDVSTGMVISSDTQPDWCKDGSREYPCPPATGGSMLSFFGIFGFVASGILICVIYFFLIRKKK